MTLPRWARYAGYALWLLLVLEVGSRVVLLHTTLLDRLQPVSESAYRLRWVHRREARGGLSPYGFDAYDPRRGWTLARHADDSRTFPGLRVRSNAAGLRGTRDYPVARTPGVPRIAVFGDSFTFGEGVGDDDTFCAEMQRRLPGAEILNFGVHGYGHDQMLLYLRDEGLRYRPDVVVLGFVFMDLERALLAFREYAKPRFEIRSPEEVLAAIVYDAWRARADRDRVAKSQLSFALLGTFARLAREGGSRPVFVHLPVLGELANADPNPTSDEATLFSFCRQQGIECFSLRPVFAERVRHGEQFALTTHWTAREHRIAGEALAAWLQSQGADRPASAP